MMAKGSPKPVVTGRKGNVGGVSTPGRTGNHKAAMMAGMKNLISPGPGTVKTAKISNMPRKDTNPKIDAGNVTPATGTSKPAAGSPKDLSMGSSGHAGVGVTVRTDPVTKRDSAQVVKP